MLTLEFNKRPKTDTLDKVRRSAMMPAVFYGPKEASTSISIKSTDFKKVWGEAGESSIIILKEGNEEHEALIHAVDVHPVTGVIRHADFYVIEKGKKLQINVPLEFIGVSEAVKSLGGILVKVLHELEIEALPKDLPHHIDVDISSLANLDSQILAKDLKLADGVTLISGPDEVIAAISVAQEEPEEAPTASIADIELSVEKGKKEEEGAEGETPDAGAKPKEGKK